MKKFSRLISMMLVLAFLCPIIGLTAFAETTQQPQIKTLYSEFDEVNKVSKEVFRVIDSNVTFYVYEDGNITYCSQISPTGMIQFSYVLATNENIVFESNTYDVDSILPIGVSLSTDYVLFDDLNSYVIKNIDTFSGVRKIETEIVASSALPTSTTSDDELNDVIEDYFGAAYVNTLRATTYKTYQGVEYEVNVFESKINTYTTPRTRIFNAGTAITAIVAWVESGGNWLAVIGSVLGELVLSVVASAIDNGVYYTIKKFTAKTTEVTCDRARNVKVVGYSGTLYWAGKTEKIYFFKGSEGWVRDTDKRSISQHADFSNLIALMDTGFNLYVEGVLNQ